MSAPAKASFTPYPTPGLYDEAFAGDGALRTTYHAFAEAYEQYSPSRIRELQSAIEKAQVATGMTFNVYAEGVGKERILPIDIIPRIIGADDWRYIEKGLVQRITALNLFIDDIYHDRKIVADKVLSRELIESCPNYMPACQGLDPPHGIWCHVTGTDIVRGQDGAYCVLEDNLRVPSGVSYLLENRELLKRTFPGLFQALNVQPVHDYTLKFIKLLQETAPQANPSVVLHTPGIYNSAYFEHSYLARDMGIELVEGRDLVVRDDRVYMLTTSGLQQVDVIYRRVDDAFLDPDVFRPDSVLGVRGLFRAYQKGNVALVNAPGTGIADDKVIYAYVPEIIRYYLGEDAVLPNVPTYICERDPDRAYVIEHIAELVVKEANASGGYGMLIGPKATKKDCETFRRRIRDNPRNYIAQPVISLSTVPTLSGNSLEPRHVDLRPFVLYGQRIEVIPGGLTRVALRKGSLVVNSSQGGGSKDTWVLGE